MYPLIYLAIKLARRNADLVQAILSPEILDRTPLIGTETDPNGKITGNEGQIYVDYLTPRIWIKMYGTGNDNNTGWS